MHRRRVITAAGVTLSGFLGGCSAPLSTPTAAVDFELWNDSAEAHTVEVLMRDSRDQVVLDRTYEIVGEKAAATPGGPVIREPGFTDATLGESFQTVAVLDSERRHEHQYEATCVNSETPDVFLIEIDPGREPNLEFDQSDCS